jgi:type VI secretion system protein ImpL
MGNSPSFAINLAKNLRQRVQELTEKLEVFAPVYVLFTKVDLIPGFHEFFLDLDWNERDRVWGATIPYEQAGGNELIALFDRHFDELYEGLRAMSVAQMSRQQGEATPPGVLTFPAEFASIKPALRAFVATLFEDNPFQFKPIFRGFYITSAIQGNDIKPVINDRILRKFSLQGGGNGQVRAALSHGYFLKELFSKVVFPDRNLVRQHTTPAKTRHKHRYSFQTESSRTQAHVLNLSSIRTDHHRSHQTYKHCPLHRFHEQRLRTMRSNVTGFLPS